MDEENMSEDDSQMNAMEEDTMNAKRLKTDTSTEENTGDNRENLSVQNNGDLEAAGSSTNNSLFHPFNKKKSLRNRNYRRSGEGDDDSMSGGDR